MKTLYTILQNCKLYSSRAMASTAHDVDTCGPTTTPARPQTSISIRPAPPIMVLDPEGDVILVVMFNKTTARFQINSNILCVASPVFRAMLGRHSQFKEASALAAARLQSDSVTTGTYELTLPDDNPKPLAAVLRILHAKHTLIPKLLTEDQLFEVAVICDKYDLGPVVMVWVDRWILLLVPDESKMPPTVVGHKWLFIAYVFKRENLFRPLTQELILTATTDESTALVMAAKDGTGGNEYLPESLISR